jgi:integrase
MSAKLTETYVKTAAIPTTGSTSIWDDEVTGFGLRVHAKGTKSFFFDFRADGRAWRISIGKYTGPQGVWTATAARLRAKELRQEVDKGGNPAREKRERRDAPTVQDLIDRYVSDHLPKLACKDENDPRNKDTRRMLALIGEHLGVHTLVRDVHGGDVRHMHTKVTESRGPVRANRVMAVCSKAFSLSLVPKAGENKAWRDQAMGNPCKGIEKNREEESGRLFGQAELEVIATALSEYPGVGADCVRLVMTTGCRPAEARKARWTEFDKEPHTWVKPSAHTKARKTHHLPLSPPAIELIERLRAKRGKDQQLVFPGQPQRHRDRKAPRQGEEPIAALWHCWHFVRDRGSVLLWAGSEDESVAKVVADLRAALQREPTAKECQTEAKRREVDLPVALLGTSKEDRSDLYSLRHSFATLGVTRGGLSLAIIGRLLGHTQARTTQRYARHADADPIREAATRVANIITGAGNGAADNVTSIGRRP